MADPDKHWRKGYSARSLAYAWEAANAALPKEMREAIPLLLEYAELFNEKINEKVGFKPFSNDQKSRSRDSLDKEISRWVLKGMGFNLA